MARLVGVDLPREKRMEIALTYIFGIGRTRATATLAATGIDPEQARQGPDRRRGRAAARLTSRPTTRSRVTCAARSPPTSGARWRSVATQGIRHRRGLPVRGQRTRTNARTRKGPKRTVAGKKKPGKK